MEAAAAAAAAAATEEEGSEELVMGDWGDEKGDELVEVVEAEAADEGREWSWDRGKCLSNIDTLRVSVIIAEEAGRAWKRAVARESITEAWRSLHSSPPPVVREA